MRGLAEIEAIRSMDKLIEFRSLCDKLTDEEFKVFVNEILKQSNSRRILTYLLYQFLNQRSSQKYAIEKGECSATEWNKILSKIIVSRHNENYEDHEDEEVNNGDMEVRGEAIEKISFHRLSKPIVGKISTFLPLGQYQKYCKLNRLCYISCCTLLAWQDRIMNSQSYTCELTQYHKVILSQGNTFNAFWFSNIKRLSVSISNFVQYMAPFQNQAPLQCIEYLDISCSSYCKSDKIEEFASMNCINFESVKEIRIDLADEEQECAFWKILSRSINVESINISGNEDYQNTELHVPLFIAEHMNECKKLKKLRNFSGIETFGLIGSLVANAVGNQLTDMKIRDNVVLLPNAMFSNLRRLSCENRTCIQILQILEPSGNIECFEMYMNCTNTNVILPLFSTQQNLRNLKISTENGVYQGMVSNLTDAVSNYPKSTLKLQLQGSCAENYSAADQIIKLIKTCSDSIENDFLLALTVSNGMLLIGEKINESLNQEKYRILESNSEIEIANRNCKLQGRLSSEL